MHGSLARRFFSMLFLLFALTLLLLVIGPGLVMATGRVDVRAHWSTANRGATGLAPDPDTERGAVVQVYAARTLGWRGAFGVHSWVSVKPADARRWTTYEVVGWRIYRGGGDAVVESGRAPDGRWFGNEPVLLTELRGEAAAAAIPQIERAVAEYPWRGRYTVWPGPNSNTFVAWIGRKVPALRMELPANAIGKDWLGDTALFALTPSRTGVQVSFYGLAGLTVGWVEGLEFNLLALNFGIDPLDLAIKLPGWGRIGWR
ncbi:MAG TPA: DUF3750 domain-containing protein [Alphaproteobacteria bacterium]|nr:DUF3750 domain-containing protein [Alphaproteobacteria bacterium]